MIRARVGALCAAMLTALPAGVAVAQFQPPPGPGGSSSATVQDRWPSDTLKPGPGSEPAAPAVKPAKPKKGAATESIIAPEAGEEPLQPAAPAHKPPPTPANVVTCSGVFAKDSTHLKLATKYDSRNIVFGQVDGPDGSKIPGSILFPSDPKRRLEVLWANDASRSETSVIAINGKSQWSAPKGMKLGLSLAALEKANGKPFKLSGFDKDGSASVTGWDGGALSNLPGGCKIGMRLRADAKAPADARNAVTGDKELASNEASVKSVKPSVIEILVGY